MHESQRWAEVDEVSLEVAEHDVERLLRNLLIVLRDVLHQNVDASLSKQRPTGTVLSRLLPTEVLKTRRRPRFPVEVGITLKQSSI